MQLNSTETLQLKIKLAQHFSYGQPCVCRDSYHDSSIGIRQIKSACCMHVTTQYLHTSLGEHVSCVSLIHVASVVLIDPSTVNSHLYKASGWKKNANSSGNTCLSTTLPHVSHIQSNSLLVHSETCVKQTPLDMH